MSGNKDISCNKMSYEKCYNCAHSDVFYDCSGGMLVACRLNGNRIFLDKCFCCYDIIEDFCEEMVEASKFASEKH